MLSRKKKKIIRRRLLVVLLAVVAAGVWLFYQWQRINKAKFVSYPEFGIPMPANYSIHGIDVSRYQQMIAWDAVKEMRVKDISIKFAFIKATEGLGNADPQFRRNWKKSKDAGLVRGAYHFFIASKDGMMQAKNFIRNVDLQPGDLPPVLDIEQLYGSTVAAFKKEVKQWLTTIENYYGVTPIIYTYVSFYEQYLGSEFDKYMLWAAHYLEYNQPRISRDWSFWQHSEEGRVNGIISKVDFNVFNGDSTAFIDLLIE